MANRATFSREFLAALCVVMSAAAAYFYWLSQQEAALTRRLLAAQLVCLQPAPAQQQSPGTDL